jgi:hypothetical protein
MVFFDSKQLSFQKYGMSVVLECKYYLHKNAVKMKQNMNFSAFLLKCSCNSFMNDCIAMYIVSQKRSEYFVSLKHAEN